MSRATAPCPRCKRIMRKDKINRHLSAETPCEIVGEYLAIVAIPTAAKTAQPNNSQIMQLGNDDCTGKRPYDELAAENAALKSEINRLTSEITTLRSVLSDRKEVNFIISGDNNTINYNDNRIDNSVNNTAVYNDNRIDNSVNTVNVDNSVNTTNTINNLINNVTTTYNHNVSVIKAKRNVVVADLITVLNPDALAPNIDYPNINDYYDRENYINMACALDTRSLYGPLGDGAPMRQAIVENYLNPGKYSIMALLCAMHYLDPDITDNHCIFIHNEERRQIGVRLADESWLVMDYNEYTSRPKIFLVFDFVDEIYGDLDRTKLSQAELLAMRQLRKNMRDDTHVTIVSEEFYDIMRDRSKPLLEHLYSEGQKLNMNIRVNKLLSNGEA